MIGTLIVYIVIVFPIAYRVYMIDKGKFLAVKLINLLITFLISWSLSHSLREQIVLLNIDFIKSLYVQVGIVSPLINFIGYVGYIIFAFLGLVVMIRLAIRNRNAYRQFKYIIPFLWVTEAIYMNYKYYNVLQSQYSNLISGKVFWYLVLIIGIYWTVIFFIYNTKSFRDFFKRELISAN